MTGMLWPNGSSVVKLLDDRSEGIAFKSQDCQDANAGP